MNSRETNSEYSSNESQITDTSDDDSSERYSDNSSVSDSLLYSDSSQSEDEEEEKTQNIDWKRYTRKNKLHYTLPRFTQNPSVNRNLMDLQNPYEFFGLFFYDEVLYDICELTDKYYQKNKDTHKRRSHHKLWQKPDLATMKCYFGQLLYIGIIKKPTLGHYWSTSVLFGFQGFKELLGEDNFGTSILAYILSMKQMTK